MFSDDSSQVLNPIFTSMSSCWMSMSRSLRDQFSSLRSQTSLNAEVNEDDADERSDEGCDGKLK